MQVTRLSASQENLANHRRYSRSPDPSLQRARSASDVRTAAEPTPSQRSRPFTERPLPHTPQGNVNRGLDLHSLPILSRLHEGHPLPNEGRSDPRGERSPYIHVSPPEYDIPHDDYIYAVPNKPRSRKGTPVAPPQHTDPSLPLLENIEGYTSDQSITELPGVGLDRKGRVLDYKGKVGGRGHAKNVGRAPLPKPDFWGTDGPHEAEFTTRI